MTFLRMSLSGGVMIAVIVLIRTLTIQRLPKRTFLLLWAAALLRLLVPVSLPSPLSVYSLIQRSTALSNLSETAAAAAETILPASNAFQASEAVTEGAKNVIANQTVPVVQPAVSPVEMTAQPIPVVSILWGIGAAACVLFFLIAYVRCYRQFRESLPVKDGYIENWLRRHPLRRKVVIRQTDRISSPLTYGIFRPVILLPSGVDWKDKGRLDYVLTHEWIHIRRFDGLAKLMLAAALCLHWFNPLVWVMYLMANRDMELSCDEALLRQFGRQDVRADYALALISMEERRAYPAVLTSHFSQHTLKERIRAIMKDKKASKAVIAAALVVVVVVVCLFGTSAQPRLSKVMDGQVDVQIVCTNLGVDEDGTLDNTTTEYYFEQGTHEFEQLKTILGRYSYHPTFGTLTSGVTGSASISGGKADYQLNLYSVGTGNQTEETHSLSAAGTREIIIDGQLYCMGLWDDSVTMSMMEELKAFLLTCEPSVPETDSDLANFFVDEDGRICYKRPNEVQSGLLLHTPSVEGAYYVDQAMLLKDITVTGCFTIRESADEKGTIEKEPVEDQDLKQYDVVNLYTVVGDQVLASPVYGEKPSVYGYVKISDLSRLPLDKEYANQSMMLSENTSVYDAPDGTEREIAGDCGVEILQRSGDWYKVQPIGNKKGAWEAGWVKKESVTSIPYQYSVSLPYDETLLRTQMSALQAYMEEVDTETELGQAEWESASEEVQTLTEMLNRLDIQRKISGYQVEGLEYRLPENAVYYYDQIIRSLSVKNPLGNEETLVEDEKTLWGNMGKGKLTLTLDWAGNVTETDGVDIDSRVYIMKDCAAIFVELDTINNTFTFFYDSSTPDAFSYKGSYDTQDGVLTAVTEDGTETFRFQVVDQDTLSFIQDGSTAIAMDEWGDSIIGDGEVFRTQESAFDR